MTNDIYPKVLVSVPSMGNPSYKTMQSLVTFAATKNFKCFFHYPEGSVIHKARNAAVGLALRLGCSHLMFIDDDMVFEPDAISRLISQDKDIIGGLCFGRTNEMVKPIAKKLKDGQMWDYSWEEVKWWKESRQVDSTGTGFLLIKREVLEALDPPHFYFANPLDFNLRPLDPPDFDLSEDTTFMVKAREKGFEVWIDPTIIIGHHGTKVFQRPVEIDNASIEIIIPTMGRFEKLEPLVKNIRETTLSKFEITFVTDEPEAIEILKKLKVNVVVSDKDCVSYAKRVNKVFKESTATHIFTGSNDIVFSPGWDIEALKSFISPATGVVAVNDMFNPNGTNFLIKKEYIDEKGGTFEETPGIVFHEYTHNFCDTELVVKSRYDFAYKFCDSAIVEHNHYLAKKSQDDWVYKLGREKYENDKKIFEDRLKEFSSKKQS